MSSDSNQKRDDSKEEVLRLPDSMPDELQPKNDFSMGAPIAPESDITPPAPMAAEMSPATQESQLPDAPLPFDEITVVDTVVAMPDELTNPGHQQLDELTADVDVTATDFESTSPAYELPQDQNSPQPAAADIETAPETAPDMAPGSATEPALTHELTPEPLHRTHLSWTKNQKRIALAAAISAAGFLSTTLWYNLGAGGVHTSNSKAIAKIIRSVNEVQRKPLTKLIWQPIFDKDIVYAGEAIRTASNAEATIEFLESGTKIDLDPDSAIVLEESAGKLALNFLQGNLLVKAGKSSGTGAADDITVKTGDQQIALGNSELSLGKTSSGQIDLQVLKGQAKIVDGDKTVTLDQGKSLSGQSLVLLKPTADDTIYIDPDSKEKVVFEWQHLNAGDYTVTLEAGPTRNSMKLVPGAMATGAAGKLEAELKVGRVYYRIVARSNDANFKQLASAVIKNTVIAKIPPSPVAPQNGTLLPVSLEAPAVIFEWSNPAQLKEVHFKLARTPDFKTVLFEKVIASPQNSISLDIKTPGQYYWQLTGKADGKNIASSKVAMVNVQITKGLPAPRLLKPNDLEKIPFDDFKENGLLLTWEQVLNAEKYKVVIESTRANEEHAPITLETELLQNRVKDLKPGTYSWSVWSVNAKGELSPQAETRQFQLVELPIVPWADGKSEAEHQYVTLKPSLELQWAKPAISATRYQVRLTTIEGSQDLAKNLSTTELSAHLNLENDGDYFAEIEAVDHSGKVVARSQRRLVRVSSAPLLPPPQFAEGLPPEIMANGNGAASVQWQTVQGAARYMMILKDEKGEPKRELAFTTSEGQLRGLMPGDYKVVLRSVDQHGRVGPESEERALKVPNTSSLRAPKMKGLKVK